MKVITIQQPLFCKEVKETTYPELQKLLDEGYQIQNTIHSVSDPHNAAGFFAVTFVLYK